MKNEVLIFQKKIGDEIYYVAEVRTGRKKLVSATMYKHKIKEGPLQPEYPSQATHSRPKPSLDPSLNSEQSENFSENQEENAKYSKIFDEEAEESDRKHRELYERYKNGDQEAYKEAVRLVAEEAKRKEYEVKVYHGTGSDGFDVADASSKFEENGEGAQAHSV